MMTMDKKSARAILTLFLIAPALARAQDSFPDEGKARSSNIVGALFNLMDVVLVLIGITAGVAVIYAIFLYLSAGGEDELKIMRAKTSGIIAAIAAASLFIVYSGMQFAAKIFGIVL